MWNQVKKQSTAQAGSWKEHVKNLDINCTLEQYPLQELCFVRQLPTIFNGL